MHETLLYALREKTEEEEKGGIDRSLYMQEGAAALPTMEIDSHRLLKHGKLITLHRHPRFTPFPPHTHNYIEMVYMVSGKTEHIVNGSRVMLSEGELLLLGQGAVQEIRPAGEGDIALSFVILPQFFDMTLRMLGEEKSAVRDFLLSCLSGKQKGLGFLHFAVADIIPIQNLVENLIWSLWHDAQDARQLNRHTMGLLFLELAAHTEMLDMLHVVGKEARLLAVLRYIEEHYRDGALQDIAAQLHYDPCFLSREIKRCTGKTFTVLMQEKRLQQSAFLLQSTSMKVSDIGDSVGYENLSYFHRIFKAHFGLSPYQFRKGH